MTEQNCLQVNDTMRMENAQHWHEPNLVTLDLCDVYDADKIKFLWAGQAANVCMYVCIFV